MRTPPEAFLIFREELKKIQIEKEKQKAFYEDKILNLNQELDYLKEQISSQQNMMITTVEYASRLETELKKLQRKMDEDDKNSNNNVH